MTWLLFLYAAMFFLGYLIGHEYSRFKLDAHYLMVKSGYDKKIEELENEIRGLTLKLNEAKILMSAPELGDEFRSDKT